MSFAKLKKQSSLGSLTAKLVKEVEKTNSTNKGDERLWKPEVDKAGNGYAVIRFLPAPNGEDLPWVKLYSHAFQGSGGWYIENSLTTLNQKDPVSEFNTGLWNSGVDSDKEIARKQKRKLSYYSNIYVVKDPLHPENEGRVCLFKYGKKIHDKIIGAMQPEFQDEVAINPFDFWQGADFKLKIKKVAGYWNYDSSEFASQSTLGNFDDENLETIYAKQYSLTAFTDSSNFKSYDELETRMNMVLKGKNQPRVDMETEEDEESFNMESVSSNSVPTPEPVRPNVSSSGDEEDTLSFFANLAEFDD